MHRRSPIQSEHSQSPFRAHTHSGRSVWLTCFACLVAGLAPLFMAATAAGQEGPSIKASAVEQIRALMAEKESRNAAQRKIESNLLWSLRQQQGDRRMDALPKLNIPKLSDHRGMVLVDLSAEVSVELQAEVQRLGGVVISKHPRFRSMRVRLPLAQIEELAAWSEVRSVRPADQFMTQMINTSEGDVAHGADTARTNFGLDGTGVSACAMSDSVDALVSLQGSGDLPGTVTVLAGQSGNPGSSEGTALLEIIHDLAPGADLFFATGAGGQAQMAQNILDLAAAGCNVIVDDVLYFTEAVFQDGIIAQAVEDVVQQGVTFVTSAGNSGNFAKGTTGVWEGDYSGVALPALIAANAMSAHDFGGGSNNNEITFDPPFFITLQWSDPFGGADNDYELFVLDAALANVIAASTTAQDGTQPPLEVIDSTTRDDLGNRIVVAKFDGDDRFIHVNTHRGMLDTGTDGQIFGHPAAEAAITVAAVNVATAAGGVFTGGVANPVQTFSSDGPRRIFFDADDSPVQAAAVAPSTGVSGLLRFGEGGQTSVVRQKPDIAAADGVSTATPGFNPFFGTSASAPHSAGILALLREQYNSIGGPNVPFADSLFNSSALDIEDPGFDNLSGNGIMMAEPLIDNAPIFADGFESGDASSWTK